MEYCQRVEKVTETGRGSGQKALTNQVRNRTGFSAASVLKRFGFDTLDLDRCREILIGLLHPKGLVCRECGHRDFSGIQEASFNRFARVQCRGCGRFFTARSGTILEGSELTERQVVMLAAGVALDLPTPILAGLVKIHPETVRRWRVRLA